MISLRIFGSTADTAHSWGMILLTLAILRRSLAVSASVLPSANFARCIQLVRHLLLEAMHLFLLAFLLLLVRHLLLEAMHLFLLAFLLLLVRHLLLEAMHLFLVASCYY